MELEFLSPKFIAEEWGWGVSTKGNQDTPTRGKGNVYWAGRTGQVESTSGTLHHYQWRGTWHHTTWYEGGSDYVCIYFLHQEWEKNHSSVRFQSREGGGTVVATSQHVPKRPPRCHLGCMCPGGFPWEHEPPDTGWCHTTIQIAYLPSWNLFPVRALSYLVHRHPW